MERIEDKVMVTNYTVNGICSGCGQCCSGVLPMTHGEFKRIKAYVLKHKIKPKATNKKSSRIDLTCPFLSADNKCMIYKVRPDICRTFICSKDIETIKKEKSEHYNSKFSKEVWLRDEIFGDNIKGRVMEVMINAQFQEEKL